MIVGNSTSGAAVVTDMASKPTLNLKDFFPYQLSILDKAVSETIARLYRDKFQLSRHEWRVLAVLGCHDEMSAKAISAYTSMEKMQISRAISRMREAQLVQQSAHSGDRRYINLSLTRKGRSVYQQIAPLVMAEEQRILSVFSAAERQQLATLMNKLQQHTHDLLADD